MNGHVHACPKCYRRIPCTYPGCDHTEPDLTLDDGTLCGPHQVCDGCEDAALAARGGIHHCQPNSLARVQLDSDGQTWRLNHDALGTVVTFCPFCGKRLAAPPEAHSGGGEDRLAVLERERDAADAIALEYKQEWRAAEEERDEALARVRELEAEIATLAHCAPATAPVRDPAKEETDGPA